MSAEIFAGPGGLHVAYVGPDLEAGDPYETFYMKSTDGGGNWSNATRLTYGPTQSAYSKILEDGDGIHFIWRDEVTVFIWNLYYRKSTDGGVNWTTSKLLANGTVMNGIANLDITSDSNGLHVVWNAGYLVGDNQIYYKRSVDGGDTWSNNTRLTNSSGNPSDPAITSDENGLYIVWVDDESGNIELYFMKSTDGGDTWGNITRLTYYAGSGYVPDITANNEGIHVVWHDNRDDQDFYTTEVYYKKSTDGGETWSNDTRLTNATGDSMDVRIAADSSSIHVVWNDDRLGDTDVYYKHTTAATETQDILLQAGWNLISMPFDIHSP